MDIPDTPTDSGPLTPSNPSPSTVNNAFSRLRGSARTIAEQRSDITPLGDHLTIDELPRIIADGKRYVEEAQLEKKANAKRTSWVSDHGIYLVEMVGNERRKTYWSCKYCDEKHSPHLLEAGSTGNAARHLRLHRKFKPSGQHDDDDDVDDTESSSSTNVLGMQRLASKRRKLEVPIVKNAGSLFKLTLIKWIIDANVSLTAVENRLFRQLLELTALGSNTISELVPTGDSIRSWILNEFLARKADIKRQLLEESRSKIHISFDLWTSPNSMSIMAVVAHYLDKSFVNRSRLIALRRLQGPHSGENMAMLLLKIVREFEITDRLGYFTIDNAESNDICLNVVLNTILPDAPEAEIQERRLRCWGHVLNLVAKAFLFGKDADAFEMEDNTNTTLRREQEQLEAWRKQGPVGKLHNIVVFIRRSTQRRELFKRISNLELDDIDGLLLNEDTKNLGVIQDNKTRWNSTYLMIIRALKKKDEIDTFIRYLDQGDPDKRVHREDHLSTEDWAILTETAHILKPLYDQTMRHQSRAKQGHHGAIWEVLPSIEFILQHFETLKSQYVDLPNLETQDDQNPLIQEPPPHDPPPPATPQLEPAIAHSTRRAADRRPVGYQPPTRGRQQLPRLPPPPSRRQSDRDLTDSGRKHFRTAINNGWEKLNKYYDFTDRSCVYVASVVLHPGLNWKYIKSNWTEHRQLAWIILAEEKLQGFYNENWKSAGVYNLITDPQYPPPPTPPSPPPLPPTREPDPFDNFLTPHTFYDDALPTADDYARYKDLPPTRTAGDNPIAWWRDRQDEYPSLSQMAFDMFSIPAMSAECERIFSLAKLIITTQRHSMNEATLEAIMCLKNWWEDNTRS